MRILLVEDDRMLGKVVADKIERGGDTIVRVEDLEHARRSLHDHEFDVIVLDLMLPDGDGRSLARDLRRSGNNIPILLLTARDETDDRVAGLDAGADDYLVKPFAISELLARLRALHRRPGIYFAEQIDYEDLSLHLPTAVLHCNKQQVRLTKPELQILNRMMRAPGQVFPKAQLADIIYPGAEGWSDNALETVIHRLRKKIIGLTSQCELRALRGLGYLLCKVRH
jgi:two-component system response regulator TctD